MEKHDAKERHLNNYLGESTSLRPECYTFTQTDLIKT